MKKHAINVALTANYGYGTGTYAECYWPDGHVLMIRCNEQDGSGTVFVTEF